MLRLINNQSGLSSTNVDFIPTAIILVTLRSSGLPLIGRTFHYASIQMPAGKATEYELLTYLLKDAVDLSGEPTPLRIPKAVIFIDGLTKVKRVAANQTIKL
ncbi:hypothetical protein V8E54_002623 [Elaphomyces granulatus]|jgi:hypothetical protein